MREKPPEAFLRREARDKAMSWQKCKDCQFLRDISTHEQVTYTCRVTGGTLYLYGCVKNGGTA